MEEEAEEYGRVPGCIFVIDWDAAQLSQEIMENELLG